jgi:hypothetical protein
MKVLLNLCCVTAFCWHTSFTTNIHPAYTIVIDKSDYRLYVYQEDELLTWYPCVFGTKDQGDKMMQGDKKTPEGSFTINKKWVHKKWHRMMIDTHQCQSGRWYCYTWHLAQ